MSYNYGFNSIGNQLVDECKKVNSDFDLITNLLKQIDDINITGEDEDENILSEIYSVPLVKTQFKNSN